MLTTVLLHSPDEDHQTLHESIGLPGTLHLHTFPVLKFPFPNKEEKSTARPQYEIIEDAFETKE